MLHKAHFFRWQEHLAWVFLPCNRERFTKGENYAGRAQTVFDEAVVQLNAGDVLQFQCSGKATNGTVEALKLRIKKLDF